MTQSNVHLANAIRALSMDAVQKANSGHPGMPMGMADLATVLWRDFLKHNPNDPSWWNRDRFVLSNGHGAMLQYSLLHLTGYDLSIEDLKQFRQLHSKTPGHPEFGETPGVEVTTGPLGQGLASAVGMAIAEKSLAQSYNEPGMDLIDHFTYVFLGDGCLMEGVSHEAASLAGTLGLGKLIAIYDDNGISIDGKIETWFTDDTVKRFESYGWQVLSIDGHDHQAISDAIAQSQKESNKPTLICAKTTIGFGSPNLAGSEKSHGAPLGDEEIAATRKQLGWEHAPFVIPEDIYQAWDAKSRGASAQSAWQTLWETYQQSHPEKAKTLNRRMSGELCESVTQRFKELLLQTHQHGNDVATRKASYKVLNEIGPLCTELMGGSADLTGSNLTCWQGCDVVRRDHWDGQYIHYGVREFGMAAMMNGMSAYGGFIPFSGTFMTFVDYSKNALRLSALMKFPTVHVLTHDSIGLGEDGPTHQPIEQLTSLRATPNVDVWRPCDDVETVVAWQSALESKQTPHVLALTRQTVPHVTRESSVLEQVHRGGYVIKDSASEPQVCLMASGSEISLCLEAQTQLESKGISTRVVSMPCMEVFARQDKTYQNSVIQGGVTIAVEAANMLAWYPWLNERSAVIGLDDFGASAPANQLFETFGLTVDNIVNTALELS